jgi:hypothetical protein
MAERDDSRTFSGLRKPLVVAEIVGYSMLTDWNAVEITALRS